jgi:hypothetical protein
VGYWAHFIPFTVLTCSSLHAFQHVSAPGLLTHFLLCPDLNLSQCSPDCECFLLTCSFLLSWFIPLSVLSSLWVPLAHSHSFAILTCPYLYTLQYVSAPHLFTFLFYLDLSLHLSSPASKWPLLTHLLSMPWSVPPSVLFRQWVPLTHTPSFAVLTCATLYTL